MKTKKQKLRLTLDKISISKLNNPRSIYGGDGTEDRTESPKCKANSFIVK